MGNADASGLALRSLVRHSLLRSAIIDPGNFATNIEAGAEYGYTLLWVVFWANLMAVLIQLLSSKLGIATGSSLAAVIRDHLPPWGTYLYWLQAEILAIATDLAEFVGAALGSQLLLGMSLLEGGSVHGGRELAATVARARRPETPGIRHRRHARCRRRQLSRRACVQPS